MSLIQNFEHPDDVDVDQVTKDEGEKTAFRQTISDDVKFLLSYFKDPAYVPGEEVSGDVLSSFFTRSALTLPT